MKKQKVQLVLFVFTLFILGIVPQYVFAGGIENKQNWSARYMATGSRNAATDGADVAAYNPAGVSFKEDGLMLEMDAQYILKNYTQKYNGATKEQDEPSLVPGMFLTYKTGDWGFFGSLTNNGGGGEVKYNDGNVITNSLNPVGKENIEAESMYITATAGTSYKFNNIISVAGGLRAVKADKSVKASGVLAGNTLVLLDYDEDAEGYGWIIGMNIKPCQDMLFAIRYESRVELEWTTKFNNSGTNATGIGVAGQMGKSNGGKFDHDLPAVAGLGADWAVNDKLNVNTSFTYYFEEDADWDGTEDKVDNSWDWGISATYALRPSLRMSCGYMRTDVGMAPNVYDLTAKMSPVLNANSFFTGLGYDINEHFTIELALAYLTYESGVSVNDGVEYDKTNTASSIGLIYKF